MKLLERQQMNATRINHSFLDFSDHKKAMSSTRGSFTDRNHNNHHLPQLNRSFSTSSCKSSKERLTHLDSTVSDLSKKLNELKLQTRVRTILSKGITAICQLLELRSGGTNYGRHQTQTNA